MDITAQRADSDSEIDTRIESIGFFGMLDLRGWKISRVIARRNDFEQSMDT